ncbi:MAG TPA: N-acetyl-gamma-glutamyl-phosphate reductase [Candidatus Dormibacteraeota bacterium]|nr:N-acetyl-gamma-glutamyl-phosphate reductase [Candidatus Dormibacteraeota bacterium]
MKVAVAGANGYAGMTLVHLLAGHPAVELVQLTSRSQVGKPWSSVFPLLDVEGVFVEEPDASLVEVVFSCLPHNVGASHAGRWLAAGARVIDLSADFRLRDASQYPIWYKQEHPAPDLLGRAVFGCPELHERELRGADLIAVPGCYAMTSILALAPAVAAGLAEAGIVVDAKSGVSGAGRSPALGVVYSEVNESIHAYAIEGHRHLPELQQELGVLAKGPLSITFVPHLVPMTRGILATCYFDLDGSADELALAYREFYQGQPFTEVVDFSPATKLVTHTNRCLINVAAQGSKAVITGVLDNLVKGAAGSAVECFNLAVGRPRTEGLQLAMQWP